MLEMLIALVLALCVALALAESGGDPPAGGDAGGEAGGDAGDGGKGGNGGDGGAAGADKQTEPPADKTGKQAPEGGGEPKPEAAPDLDKALGEAAQQRRKETGRLVGVIKTLQTRNKELERELQGGSQGDPGEGRAAAPDDRGDAGAARGEAKPERTPPDELERDADGNVRYHGAWVSPDLYQHLHDRDQRLERLERDSQERARAGREAEAVQALGNLMEVVEGMVTDARKGVLPDLEDADAKLLDGILLDRTDRLLTQRLSDGEELSEELVEGCAKEGFAAARRLFAHFGAAQVRDNQQYAETHKVKSDGTPATQAPKSLDEMTPAERRAAVRKAEQAAEAMRSGG